MPNPAAKRSECAHTRLLSFVTDECKPGDRLAPEAELSRWLGVSRPALREVLSTLAATGVIERRWGIGTFVAESPHAAIARLEELAPLTDIIRQQGRSADVRLLAATKVCGPSEAHAALQTPDDTPIWELTRLYSVDGVPAIYLEDYVHSTIGGRQFDPALLTTYLDLMPLLEHEYRASIQVATTTLEPEPASAEVATALSLEPGHLVLATRQTAYDSTTNAPTIYTYSLSNPTAFTYTIVRRRRRLPTVQQQPARRTDQLGSHATRTRGRDVETRIQHSRNRH